MPSVSVSEDIAYLWDEIRPNLRPRLRLKSKDDKCSGNEGESLIVTIWE